VKFTDIEVIAVGRSIRELKRLRKVYGCGRWRSSKELHQSDFLMGTIHRGELHWYEAHGIGRKEIKIKRIIS
jgi:hypothetical protein